MIYILGIDIASRKSAFTILNEDKSVFISQEIELKPIFKYENDIEYFNELKKQLNNKLMIHKENLRSNCIIVAEHNVRNETLTKSLGMWIAILSELEPLRIDFKEPTKWYYELKLGTTKDKREVRKQKSKDLYYKNNKEVEWEVSEDIADSYCIALSWFSLEL